MRKKRLRTAIFTVAIAIAVGHVMQFGIGTGAGEPQAGAVPVVARASAAGSAGLSGQSTARVHARVTDKAILGLPRPPAEAMRPDVMTKHLVRRAVVPADFGPLPDEVRAMDTNAFGLPCERRLVAEPREGAMVRLVVVATCDQGKRVEIHHGNIAFAILTSSYGQAEVEVPALAERAKFTAVFADGEETSTLVVVPEAAAVGRVALSWHGPARLSLHAFESGAGYGDPGHVHANMAGEPGGTQARTGRMIGLGDTQIDTPARAEIYTYPSGAPDAGAVTLQIEAEVTQATCGKEVLATAVEIVPGDGLHTMNVEVAMPACDAVGDILVLKNVLRDLRIASR